MQCTRSGQRSLMMKMLLLFVAALTPGLINSSSLTNVALNKPAAQSSIDHANPSLTAEKAVDGDHNVNHAFCMHTAYGEYTQFSPNWWIVDLLGFYEIYSVQITNRGDCCGDRLRDFNIQVFTVNPMTSKEAQIHTCYYNDGPIGTGMTRRFRCSQRITGRYIRIIMYINTGDPMHMCEVEVMGKTPGSTNSKYVRTSGNKAVGVVLREVTSRSVMQCLMWCSSDVSCSAVNMSPKTWTSAGWSTVCQLLSFGGIGQPASTTADPDWDFYHIKDL